MSASAVPSTMTSEAKDPGSPLRFVAPSTPPPFGNATLVLKQAETERFDELGRRAMSLFSGHFDRWEQNRPGDMNQAQTMLASLSPHEEQYDVRTDTRPDRRYSGDGYLSATRYHSLCQSPDGRDGGTMLRELLAYSNVLASGVLSLYDLTEPTAFDSSLQNGEAPDLAEPEPTLLISIPPFTASRHEWLEDAAKRWETTQIRLPLGVGEVTFQRLIDLRSPQTAEWFTRNLTRLHWINDDGGELPAFPNKPPLDRFSDLLPSLMVQGTGGGNGATRIAGQWMRSIGADALVYPSARSDSRVDVRDGDVTGFYGWALVDYREAHPVRLQTIDLTPNWIQYLASEIDEPPQALYADAALRTSPERGCQGSWSWHHVEQANSAGRLFLSAIDLYTWARNGASPDQHRLLALMLGATDRAEILGKMSGWLVQALLGDERARRATLESVSVGLDPAEARLIDLPGAFRAMDARIAQCG